MKRGICGFFLTACCGALLMSGCANKEMVKKDEGVAPAAPAAEAPAAKPEAAPAKPAEQQAAEQKPAAAPAAETSAQKAAESSAALQTALEKIYFNFDSAKLSPAARATLEKNAALLKKTPAKLSIEGHCDERGSDEYNLALGEKRAKAAADYLVTMGIPADQITTISYGKEKPVATGHDEASWAKNRRDEFVVVK